MAMAWRRVDKQGGDFKAVLSGIAALPAGQLWRMSTAGDLPGQGNEIDADALRATVEANRGRKGFTYTHKPVTSAAALRGNASMQVVRSNREAIAAANLAGFTINVSCDSLAECDELDCFPMVVVLPSDAPSQLRTPRGKRVIVCPAQTRDDVTCLDCGLCQRQGKDRAIVGFRAHGYATRKVSLIAASSLNIRNRPVG